MLYTIYSVDISIMYTMYDVSIIEGYIYICYGLLYLYDICFYDSIYKALRAVTSHPTSSAREYMTGLSKV